MFRISILLVMLQCGTGQLAEQIKVAEPRASYSKYVPGMGGGAGIEFIIEFEEDFPEAEIISLIINSEEVPVEVTSRSPLVLHAKKFYPGNEPGKESNSDRKMPLFTARDYKAEITFRLKEEVHKLIITEFLEGETIYHP